MKSKIIIFVLAFLCQISFGQNASEQLIHGRIIAESANVAGVTIVSKSTKKAQ